MDYKQLLRKNPNWLKCIEKIDFYNEYKRVYAAWLIYSYIDIIKLHSDILSPTKIYNEFTFIALIKQTVVRHKSSQLLKKELNSEYQQLLINEETPALFYDLYTTLSKENYSQNVKPKLFAAQSDVEFNSFLKTFLFWHKNWSKAGLFNLINTNHVKYNIIDEYDDTIIIEVFDFHGAKSIGTHSWCISRKEEYFKAHKFNTERLFFIYDFSKSQYENDSLIGVTIPDAPVVYFKYSFDRFNHPFKCALKEKFNEIILGKRYNSNELLAHLHSLNEPFLQFQYCYDMELSQESMALFRQFIYDDSDDMLLALHHILFTMNDEKFIFDFIDKFEMTSKELSIFIQNISLLISDMNVFLNRDFFVTLFDTIEHTYNFDIRNDIVLDTLRCLSCYVDTNNTLAMLLNYTVKKPDHYYYYLGYLIKTEAIETLTAILPSLLEDNLSEDLIRYHMPKDEANTILNLI